MKRIRIKYLDWWEGFNPEDYKIHNILSKHYEIEQSENPDYVFCSLFSKEALKYNAVRILYSGENFCPDFNLFDYAIGFDYLIFGDRYIRYPNYLFNIKYSQETNMMLNKHTISDELFSNKTDFCSFVVSNGNADPIRDLFFDKLSEYKRVNSGGKYRNNIGIPQGVENKYEFQKKHKFVIAFENSSQPGYTTEKLIQAFSAGSIPIYWGDPCITQLFNEEAMIILENQDDIDNVIHRIIQIDNDDALYKRILSRPAVKTPSSIIEFDEKLDSFLTNIIDQPIEKSRRRTQSSFASAYYGIENGLYNSRKRKIWQRLFPKI